MIADILFYLLLFIAILPPLSQFILYPAVLSLSGMKIGDRKTSALITGLPTVDMIIAVRNGEQLIGDKIANCQSLKYPSELINFIIVSDGSTDGTDSILEQTSDCRFTFYTNAEHVGKANALNLAVSKSQSDVLVFSDTDAILCPDAIDRLINKMVTSRAAGVCGQRILKKTTNAPQTSQQKYISMDSWLKAQESNLGFLTSNDGKLYAILRKYHKPIAEGVSDDMFSLLNILCQRQRFVFEGSAKAFIETPSRNEAHDIQRRRRITCRSLNNFKVFSQLLNPVNYGFVSFALIANKVMRRCLPISLICLLLLTVAFINQNEFFKIMVVAQLIFYATAAFVFFLKPQANRITKFGYLVLYFVLGNIGMLLGLVDFLSGKKVTRWEPLKND